MWTLILLIPVFGLYFYAWFYDYERREALTHYKNNPGSRILWHRYIIHQPEQMIWFYK